MLCVTRRKLCFFTISRMGVHITNFCLFLNQPPRGWCQTSDPRLPILGDALSRQLHRFLHWAASPSLPWVHLGGTWLMTTLDLVRPHIVAKLHYQVGGLSPFAVHNSSQAPTCAQPGLLLGHRPWRRSWSGHETFDVENDRLMDPVWGETGGETINIEDCSWHIVSHRYWPRCRSVACHPVHSLHEASINYYWSQSHYCL